MKLGNLLRFAVVFLPVFGANIWAMDGSNLSTTLLLNMQNEIINSPDTKPVAKATAMVDAGICLHELKNYQAASVYFKRAKQVRLATSAIKAEADFWLLEMEFRKGVPMRSKSNAEYFAALEKLIKVVSNPNIVFEIYVLLSEIKEADKDLKAARALMEKARNHPQIDMRNAAKADAYLLRNTLGNAKEDKILEKAAKKKKKRVKKKKEIQNPIIIKLQNSAKSWAQKAASFGSEIPESIALDTISMHILLDIQKDQNAKKAFMKHADVDQKKLHELIEEKVAGEAYLSFAHRHAVSDLVHLCYTVFNKDGEVLLAVPYFELPNF